MSCVFAFTGGGLLVAASQDRGPQFGDELFAKRICVHCDGVVRCPVRLQRPIEADVVGMDDQIVQTTRICSGLRGTFSQNTEIHKNGGCGCVKRGCVYVHVSLFVKKSLALFVQFYQVFSSRQSNAGWCKAKTSFMISSSFSLSSSTSSIFFSNSNSSSSNSQRYS